MADFSALPLFTDAFLADTAHLSDAECGLYLRLLLIIWRSPGCRVPNDEVWLAKRFQRPLDACRLEVMPIIKEFCQSDGNWITQKRLTREFEYVKSHSKKQSARAKSRWSNNKKNAGAYAERHASGNAPTPSPTPTPTERESFSEFDFLSDDGTVKITKGEIEVIEKDLPNLKNVRGLIRNAARSWASADTYPNPKVRKAKIIASLSEADMKSADRREATYLREKREANTAASKQAPSRGVMP